jgi:predicted DsbA family dithiol-disulfide isomerase
LANPLANNEEKETMSDNKARTLQIDMVSDVVCPWCTFGYQRLHCGVEQFPDLQVELVFQPFELNPKMPTEGQNVNEHIAEKYGADEATTQRNRQQLRALGEAEGVTFNADNDSRIYNTFLAHKLLLKAEELGNQEHLKLALFQAYFAGGENVSDPEVLLNIATESGFLRQEAQEALDDETLSQKVREKERRFSSMGISAVPTFLFDGQYTISGAQEPEVLANVIREILNLTPSEK